MHFDESKHVNPDLRILFVFVCKALWSFLWTLYKSWFYYSHKFLLFSDGTLSNVLHHFTFKPSYYTNQLMNVNSLMFICQQSLKQFNLILWIMYISCSNKTKLCCVSLYIISTSSIDTCHSVTRQHLYPILWYPKF